MTVSHLDDKESGNTGPVFFFEKRVTPTALASHSPAEGQGGRHDLQPMEQRVPGADKQQPPVTKLTWDAHGPQALLP